ncbi:P-loop containing nucleoside triphosphate hydrolase protein [Choiromyces venosus 120613-1]|uniref:P-loop containing nucleoside triphosphate hydrolase protein n=1 Tax=Choiromyces venosus 120613-1 TaxID=1336337 RepID=A0A3N4JAB6_9PEZI|nr:P-loop containing nucleoside triphosphate hydrolase protein [Choiromyces venosus 120613-1]
MCITWNRLILLHGPPGSGKTSLCRALAQKLSIRLSKRFSDFQLVEINSHSLFSKWFSESGKLVGKMFDDIFQTLESDDTFVVVLIDEVESLTSARKSAANGNEPSDSLRVIVLTTSNLLEAMDAAFLDRADIKQYVNAPTASAIYIILRTCLNELIRCGLIEEQRPIPCPEEARMNMFSQPNAPSSRLWRCANGCTSFSGRTLRRLPVLMHAGYIQRDKCTLGEALEALEMVVQDVKQEQSTMHESGNVES